MMSNHLDKFILFLKFELRLSDNTVKSYSNDLNKYLSFLSSKNKNIESIGYDDIREYVVFLSKKKHKASSINRNISSIKRFHLYLLDCNVITTNPSDLLEFQKNRRNFPDTLSVVEIEKIFNSIKTDDFIGMRDLSMLTLLYSSGLRVSELVDLQLSNIFFNEEYIKIIGKGNKERLVPIGLKAQKHLTVYINNARNQIGKKKDAKGYAYLSYRLKKMTRMAVFNVIKKYCLLSGINKKVSPHTFRHSFATHMLEGGADLRVVQELLGHESISTTEIYTHLDRTYLKEVHKLCHPRG